MIPLFRAQKKKYGQPLLPSRVWARQPRLFLAIAGLYGTLDRSSSPIDPLHRLLVTVRVSQINRCDFCVDINAARLFEILSKQTTDNEVGSPSQDKLFALSHWRESSLYDEQERAILDYTESMIDTRLAVTDAQTERLGLFLDDDGLMELTALIAFQNLSSSFNAALDIPSQSFCAVPLEAARQPSDVTETTSES